MEAPAEYRDNDAVESHTQVVFDTLSEVADGLHREARPDTAVDFHCLFEQGSFDPRIVNDQHDQTHGDHTQE